MPLTEHPVLVISLDDLIRIKRHIQRPKDQIALLDLLAIKRVLEEDGKTGGESKPP